VVHTLYVDEMLAELPAELFQEWLAYFRIDPWDEYRGDLRSGIVASIADAQRVNARVKPPLDYMPLCRAERKRPADQKALRKTFGSFAEKWNKR